MTLRGRLTLAVPLLVLILGAKNLGTTKVTEPLDIPWDEHGADD